MIYVAGIGPGHPSFLTEAGRKAIECSQVLIGGKRNLEGFPEFQGEKMALGNNLMEVLAFMKKQHSRQTITVLASGDPLIYGIGRFLSQHFNQEEMVIIPGISAVQYFFSRIPMDMNDLYITSSHGKVPDFDRLLSMEKVAMVTDGIIGPAEIAEEILKRKLRKVLYIGENLSYEEEKISCLKPEEVAGREFNMNVVVIVDEK